MSLPALAHHMAATGRGPDSMLVHMSPREVHGLQALAMAHGGTLTINPHTGLPEAGFLDSILPALAGFALNTFVPGLGEAVGGIFGLGGAAGTGIAVGGATALASGDLGKGLMAGLGAYGGAGIGGSLASAGDAAMAGPPTSAMGVPEGAAVQAASPVGTYDRLKAGMDVASAAPTDFMKSNLMNLGFAAAPALSGVFDEQSTSSGSKIHPGYIRVFKTDPVTGRSYQTEAVRADEWGGRPAIEWGGVPKPQGYARGGMPNRYITRDLEPVNDDVDVGFRPLVAYYNQTPEPVLSAAPELAYLKQLKTAFPDSDMFMPPTDGAYPITETPDVKTETTKGVPVWGSVGPVEFPVQTPEYAMLSDSEKAQRYLMGEGPNPFLFYHSVPARATVNPTEKAAEGTKEIATAIKQQQRGGNRGTVSFDPGAGIAQLGGSGFTGATRNAYGDSGPTTGAASLANQAAAYLGNMGLTSLSNALAKNVDTNYGHEGKLANAAALSAAMQGVPAANPMGADPSQGGGRTSDGGEGGSGLGGNTGRGGGEGGGGMGGGGDARGGFLNHGRFDQRYAYGGGITALADGGMYNLGSYSDGGRLLRGPGDGVSDDIPATIGEKQPARLADGEFVVPARIVSELGNGSTEAGARKLYAMMDRVQKARTKTVGKNKVAANTRAEKYLPA